MASVSQKHDATERFASGLLNPVVPTPETVTTAADQCADMRYDVYRNNATASLITALGDIFPGTRKIIGGELFSMLARDYVRAHPPSSPLLFRYGHAFSDFATAYEPVAHLGYLRDVIAAERQWLTAFHAADDPVLTPDILTALPQDKLGEIIFHTHAATATTSSDFPVFSIFAMNRDLMELAPVDMSIAQAILITRPAFDVVVTGIDAATAAFIDRFQAGATLGDAMQAALAINETFDISAAIGLALQTGALRAPTITKNDGTQS